MIGVPYSELNSNVSAEDHLRKSNLQGNGRFDWGGELRSYMCLGKIGFPIRAGVGLDLLVDAEPLSLVSHSGKFAMHMEEDAMIGEFVTVHRDKTRKGTTTRSVPSKRKRPECHLGSHVIVAGGS